MIWLAVAIAGVLLGVGLFVCTIYAWNEPVRRCGYLDFTRRPR